MPIISGLDIPSGLESLFYAILGLPANGADSIIRKNNVHVPTARRSGLARQSLFIFFQSIYDGLTSLQKTAWTTYWETLPFGSHSGSGGWPGSGYSAFVYVNAPLHKLGLPLVYDPFYANLIFNGDFGRKTSGWSLDGLAYAEGRVYNTKLENDSQLQQAGYLAGGDFSCPSGNYRLEFDTNNPSADFIQVFIFSELLDDVILDGQNFSGSGHQSFDFNVPSDAGMCSLALVYRHTATGFVDNISLTTLP